MSDWLLALTVIGGGIGLGVWLVLVIEPKAEKERWGWERKERKRLMEQYTQEYRAAKWDQETQNENSKRSV